MACIKSGKKGTSRDKTVLKDVLIFNRYRLKTV